MLSQTVLSIKQLVLNVLSNSKFLIKFQSRFIWFSEFSFEHNSNYHLIGVLCGLAIYNSTIGNLILFYGQVQSSIYYAL